MFDRIDTIADFQAAVAHGHTPGGWTQLSTTRDHKALVMAVWPGMEGEMEGFLKEAAKAAGAVETDFRGSAGRYLDFPLHERSSMTIDEGRAFLRVGLNEVAVFTSTSTYYGPPGLVSGFDFGVALLVPKDFLWESPGDAKVHAFRVPFFTSTT